MTVIFNFCLGLSITFHGVFCGFRVGRGIGTTSLEANILQQPETMKYEFLYEISIDIYKAYGALERDSCIGLLLSYR